MRLTPKEQAAIQQAIHSVDPQAKIYLYGSRVQSELKGGDIDLLVLSALIGFSEKIDILIEIKTDIGEQKIDLVIRKPHVWNTDPFVAQILPTAIEIGHSD